MITIFTDGSSRGNPGRGGWGSIVATDDMVTELGGREDNTTNNRMELTAVIEALSSLSRREREMTIYTDSLYVLSGSTRWVYGWQRNDWKTSQKEDVLNRDLWEKMLVLINKRIIDWQLLKGHSGIAPNERCDVIATSFADGSPAVLYKGSRERYGINLTIDIKKEGIKKKSKSKAYSYVSMLDGNIQIHKTWDECKRRVSGKSKAKFKKTSSPEDEENIIKEFSELSL
ncbi:MAG: ribonuclease HI [Candidatus Paceibacterota bacterium]